jgi:hypothetical protein
MPDPALASFLGGLGSEAANEISRSRDRKYAAGETQKQRNFLIQQAKNQFNQQNLYEAAQTGDADAARQLDIMMGMPQEANSEDAARQSQLMGALSKYSSDPTLAKGFAATDTTQAVMPAISAGMQATGAGAFAPTVSRALAPQVETTARQGLERQTGELPKSGAYEKFAKRAEVLRQRQEQENRLKTIDTTLSYAYQDNRVAPEKYEKYLLARAKGESPDVQGLLREPPLTATERLRYSSERNQAKITGLEQYVKISDIRNKLQDSAQEVLKDLQDRQQVAAASNSQLPMDITLQSLDTIKQLRKRDKDLSKRQKEFGDWLNEQYGFEFTLEDEGKPEKEAQDYYNQIYQSKLKALGVSDEDMRAETDTVAFGVMQRFQNIAQEEARRMALALHGIDPLTAQPKGAAQASVQAPVQQAESDDAFVSRIEQATNTGQTISPQDLARLQQLSQ